MRKVELNMHQNGHYEPIKQLSDTKGNRLAVDSWVGASLSVKG